MKKSLAPSWGSLKLVYRLVSWVFPQVDAQLNFWRQQISQSPDAVLAQQGLASIRHKRFHAQGGSVYCLYPGVKSLKEARSLIKFIVALQTISDYLDNLCDRAGYLDGQAFRQLHLAMTEALTLQGELSPYYRYYPHGEDGGYLKNLVETCRQELKKLPGYPVVQADVIELAELYSKLQTYKHVEIQKREALLKNWAKSYLRQYPEISCWEFAAATGSTLGMFILVAAATAPVTKEEARRIKESYFPWITGLHILLDYFIDQEEDKKGRDFNFVAYYESPQECLERLLLFWEKAKGQALSLPHPQFHLTVIEGLLAMYLSDPKAQRGTLKEISRHLLQAAGPRARILHRMCCFLRHRGKI